MYELIAVINLSIAILIVLPFALTGLAELLSDKENK